MRLPARYQTRWVYAAVAFLTALAFCFVFFGLLSAGSEQTAVSDRLALAVGFAISAVPAALIAWPGRTPRTKGQMVISGLLTVLMAFGFIGIFVAIAANFSPDTNSSIWEILLGPLLAGPMFILFGSLFTAGIPHILGMVMSLLFREESG